jgi:hypothetical protein
MTNILTIILYYTHFSILKSYSLYIFLSSVLWNVVNFRCYIPRIKK